MRFVGLVAISNNHGLGKENTIPWRLKDDMKFLKMITMNNVVIMGNNTFLSIPEKNRPLPGRINIVLTSNATLIESSNESLIYTNYANLFDVLQRFPDKTYFVVGGSEIYKLLYDKISTFFITFIEKEYDVDVYFDKLKNDFSLVLHSERHWSEEEQCHFRFLKYERNQFKDNHDEIYKNLCYKVLLEKNIRPNRTEVDTLSIFGEQISFDIEKNVPLLTTKRVAWKSCIEELLWFMRGDTDANILKNKNVNIWNGNSTREFLDSVGLNHLDEGDCGANYSFQWRYFGQKYVDCNTKYIKKTKFDQINNIITKLKTDPYSRRIFLSAWNPLDLENTVLPPCHVSAQFYVDSQNYLSCHMYQRSCDVFLGLPFNIFSYTVLTYILALKCNLTPKRLIISLGDTHIYTNHINQVKQQLKREIYSYPKLILSSDIVDKEIEDITIDDFQLVGYYPHPSIKAPMAV